MIFRSKSICGTKINVRVLNKHDCFGENMIGRKHVRFYTLTAHTECKLLILQVNTLKPGANAACMMTLLLNILHHLGRQNVYLRNQIAYSKINPLKTRVAVYLIHSRDHYQSNMFTVPFNREEMANYLGATRPALSKVLSLFKDLELIDYYKNSFKINNLEGLREQ